MATTLTFQIGRRPGIGCRRRLFRRRNFGLSGSQRLALAELIRGPAGEPRSRLTRKGSRFDFVWQALLAFAFVLGGLALFEGFRSVQGADASLTTTRAQPQVDVTITRLAPVIESAQAAAPNHSSTAVKRTM